MKELNWIGGIDVGGTKLAATVANASGAVFRVVEPTVRSGPSSAVPHQAIRLLRRACAEAGIADVDALGVSSCGPFAREDGDLVLIPPNLCGGLTPAPDLPNDWTRIPLEAELKQQGWSPVIRNDGVAALIAERSFGALQDEPDCAYVTWSTGVGFGLCVDGRILMGKHGNAGHAGHQLLDPLSKALCGCGNLGDLEALASGRNLGLQNEGGYGSTQALFDAARAGDAQARGIALEAARWMGRGLYNLVAILDLRRIVIGGSVWQHHGDWLGDAVRAELSGRLPALTDGVLISSAGLGERVGDVAALVLVMPDGWMPQWRASLNGGTG